ncbi:class I SAM-dependent DNA methyltransferase [Cohnella caldifontis]|uniref:class I SAM-dependent DNA methyltransferase n=1 Tax=Cohnella caldifontis TaxID=3027471 RepID=UPI0023EA8F27|nr:class I SAM-dependent methyltransferase [Cohnella sp. YIM B05605]
MRSYREFASVYDRLMEEMPYGEWMSYARQCFGKYGMPRSVVDLGCGTGNLSIPLAKSGFEVFGIDLSAEMLAIARSKWDQPPVRGQGGTIRWLQQDMRDWELPEPVDAVLSFCDCLNYLTEEADVAAAFRSTYAGLAPGGLFVFDVLAPRTLEAYAEEQPFVYDEKDVAYLWTSEYDAAERVIRHDLTFFVRDDAGGPASGLYRRFTESHTQRSYEPDWLADQLAAAGFELLHRSADFGWETPTETSERLFYVARKPR